MADPMPGAERKSASDTQGAAETKQISVCSRRVGTAESTGRPQAPAVSKSSSKHSSLVWVLKTELINK